MKKITLVPILIIAVMLFNLVAQSANLPTDPNPTVSVLVDCSSTEILRNASSIRTQNKNGYLNIMKKPASNPYADGVLIYSTADTMYRSAYACVDQNINVYSTVGGSTYVSSLSSDRVVKTVGAYHLQSSNLYSDLASAKNELDRITSKGLTAFIAYIDGRYGVRIGDFTSSEQASSKISEYSSKLGFTNISYSIQSANNKTDYSNTKDFASIISGNETKEVNNFPTGIYILDGNGNKTQKTGSGSSLSVVGEIPNCITLINNDTGNIIMEFESQSEILSVSSNDNALIYHRNKDTDGECYVGDLNFTYKDGQIRTVNYAKTQDYLKIVVPTEIGYYKIEALKVQAIAARNFALSKFTRNRHGDVMLCNTTHCQAYQIYGDYYINNDGTLREDRFKYVFPAVDETIGEVGVYNNRIAEIIYADSFGGKSLTDADAWYAWDSNKGTYVRPTPNPYYPSVTDPFDTTKNAFSFDYSKQDLYNMAYNGGANNKYLVQFPAQIAAMGISTIEQIDVIRRSESGIPTEIDLVNGNNRIQIKGAINILQFFRLKAGEAGAKSPNFNLSDVTLPNADGIFTISGMGWGHNVGMSQTGAMNRSDAGQNYKDILQFYYSTNLKIHKIS
ncbi:MAG: SpoIID/LytB domain-containing protein [Clostridia bacterium]